MSHVFLFRAMRESFHSIPVIIAISYLVVDCIPDDVLSDKWKHQ
jgi:hypothetical protein